MKRTLATPMVAFRSAKERLHCGVADSRLSLRERESRLLLCKSILSRSERQRSLAINRGSQLHRLLTAIFLTLIALLCSSTTIVAQDAARARGNLLTGDSNEGVLMLNSGRIVSGKIKQVSTGYLVTSRSGYIAVARGDVRFAANDLSELYLLQKRELKDPSVAEQMQLAEWCFAQKLNAYAAKELIAVLGRDPQHEPARRLLARLDDDQQRETTTQTREASSKKIADDEALSLAGLKTATAQKFAGSVQPLLHNKCGNIRCHGANSENEFRLTRGTPGTGNHRIYSERNLAAILKHIDLDRPYDSKILKIAEGSHAGQTMFSGHSGAEQKKLLSEWVLQAARDLNPKAAKQPTPSVFAGGFNAERVTSQEPSTDARAPITKTAATERTPSKKSLADAESLLTDAEKSNFRKVLESAEADAFDPEEFNRKFAR